ncbi:6-hydroxymethylpterin diphosphokinase MptE-like protein [Pseudodesulfovibrio sediminis]|uniref:6-hydroxymethylpterin diphosphokinase MptE-like domain-containing protein n=1 Tax=Pseudodesulfovibrio sediminis TaxID=2810563 RepID=A0ABM7P733_9BACT|nr:6-hydroxymethylpterin diphosphokinase MptE-like protein [Pseudodesulfovibrio sediminis]BCS89171.1 hypothetical protein PSDVSF_24130 [Pseudodesulfovibrio sediminis]
MENSKIAALVELGILCRGEPVEVHGDGALDTGPHTISAHNQLCRFENPGFQFPFADSDSPTYTFFPPETTMHQAVEATRLVVLLGAADSPEMRACLKNQQLIVVVFEPDDRALVNFLESVKLAGLNRQNFFCFTGNPYSFNPALQDLLPPDMFRQGTPVFLVTERISRLYGDWAAEVIEYLEVLHYRHAIYGISGQSFARSRPVRNISRGLLHDQQVHAFENIGDYLRFPPIAHLTDRFIGHTAILVAAGPDLSSKFEFIRRNRDRAVIICVNNAVKPLVEAGIHPHFVIINDTSIASGAVFRHIPVLPETILVGHALSDLGGDHFGQKYLFGSFLPELFGAREMIKLHGSVISTAFGLAVHLGCARAVLVGAQLASENPWGLGYAKGTVKEEHGVSEKPLINRHPQLYPVTAPSGKQLYTTINFRDAALWLAEVVRLSGMTCINTSADSILYGQEIVHDPMPVLPEADVATPMEALFEADPPTVERQPVLRYLNHEEQKWVSIRDAARVVLGEEGDMLIAKGMAVLEQLDQNGVTSLVERFDDFRNTLFHEKVFEGSASDRQEGLRYYFKHIFRMSQEFLTLIDKARHACL